MNKPQKPLTFYKMHGLGNDFMVVEAVTQAVELPPADIASWGDRHTGIGFDQLLVIEPPTSGDADFCFRIYNKDGSVAEQCGNGTRAVALLARHLQLSKKAILLWQTPAGMVRTHFTSPQQIETTMTVPVLTLADIPFAVAAAEAIESTLPGLNQFSVETDGERFTITPVSMGNPHGVVFVEDIVTVDVAGIGARLSRHAAFPAGANIGFCQVIDQQFVRLRVYERGVGETSACGSGACAAIVAARLHEYVGERVKVSLPGGKLRITWLQHDGPVTMTGAASIVYRGELHT